MPFFFESKSGGHPGIRDEFNKMIEMIEAGKANGIVTWHLDRIARNPQDNGYVQQMMDDGKNNWILTEGRDYNPDDDILYAMEAVMSSCYRKTLMRNVRRGLKSKASKG